MVCKDCCTWIKKPLSCQGVLEDPGHSCAILDIAPLNIVYCLPYVPLQPWAILIHRWKMQFYSKHSYKYSLDARLSYTVKFYYQLLFWQLWLLFGSSPLPNLPAPTPKKPLLFQLPKCKDQYRGLLWVSAAVYSITIGKIGNSLCHLQFHMKSYEHNIFRTRVRRFIQ